MAGHLSWVVNRCKSVEHCTQSQLSSSLKSRLTSQLFDVLQTNQEISLKCLKSLRLRWTVKRPIDAAAYHQTSTNCCAPPEVHIRVGCFQSTGRMGSPAVCSRKTSRRAATEIRVPWLPKSAKFASISTKSCVHRVVSRISGQSSPSAQLESTWWNNLSAAERCFCRTQFVLVAGSNIIYCCLIHFLFFIAVPPV